VIEKTKNDVAKHLQASNDTNAKIWAETLINEENLVPCYDVAATMCDQVKGRLEHLERYGAPPDMQETFSTLFHLAPKLDVEELKKATQVLSHKLGATFIANAERNKKLINPVVAKNIDFIKPSDGQIVYRLR